MNGYIARSASRREMIYCTDGEFHHQDMVGPGNLFAARLYKTERGAAAVRGGTVIAERV